METLEVFFVAHPGLCLLLILGSTLAYVAVSLWPWHRKSKVSEKEAVTTPDWVSDLPPVYTAENVVRGQECRIWCVDTKTSQRFHVREVRGKAMHVRMSDSNGTVCEGWATEIRSDTFLHDHHLLKRIPRESLAA